jgi:hypothetical protein
MKTLFTTVIILLSIPLLANDGIYRSNGGQLYPTQETRISLEREVLSFKVRDQVAQVDILFEFFNPEDTTRVLQVGFQAPGAAGDISHEEANSSQITNFRVMHHGKTLPYSQKVAACEDCVLKDPGELTFNQVDPGVFVYLFNVRFAPGANRIQHSYRFRASNNVSIEQT